MLTASDSLDVPQSFREAIATMPRQVYDLPFFVPFVPFVAPLLLIHRFVPFVAPIA